MTKIAKIAQLGESILRNQAKPVVEASNHEILELIDTLINTAIANNGVGIAAPQISESYRLFIIASRPSDRYPHAPTMLPTAMINPRILNHSEETAKDWEGCLSVPNVRGLVPRYKKIEVEYTTREGETKQEILTDFIARIFQHELDHLDGIVFTDRIEDEADLYTELEYQQAMDNGHPRQFAQRGEPPQRNCLAIDNRQLTISLDVGCPMENIIGVDLGGSAIKMGVFIEDGTCLKSISLPTPLPANPKPVVNAIALGIKQLQQDFNCKAIGLGMPGPTDKARRIARKSINLPGWNDVPVADWLEAQTGLTTILENDANCAAMGEAWLGAGSQFRDFILLTLGTGVGGGIFIDGKLFTGRFGAAGELGLITLNSDGLPCRSGNQGSLEQYASIGAILRMTGKNPGQMGELAQAGDFDAIEFWQNYGRVLGAGVASLIYVLTPEAVIIGGGISASSQFFLPSMMEEINRRVVSPSRTDLQLLTAELGNQAGMLGAAKLVWNKYS